MKNKAVSSDSEDAFKADFTNIAFLSAGKDTYEEAPPCAVRTSFIEQGNRRSRSEVEYKPGELRDMLMQA